ncbi:MAG: type II toxin-antitoxin system RelE/ParE family toxin [Steroidobacteraceae bacterium]|nr:type II toxin-antitoxin system RelE/ParE family toxin [Steroidobacteraceae bacterium]MCW5573813.1 type II toxin-antitoxin system RelE/ParE family toxin [Steroidobacteraceae bacterium]
MRRKSYVLTARAAADLHEARAWSRARWGGQLTNRYFQDLHEGAQYIAQRHASIRGRHELAGGTSLLLYPVREHYLVYEPLAPGIIAIVAVIRQGRNIPAILQKWAAPIRRELIEIRGRIERREISLPARRVPKPRYRKK